MTRIATSSRVSGSGPITPIRSNSGGTSTTDRTASGLKSLPQKTSKLAQSFVGGASAALRVVPGSHRHGRLDLETARGLRAAHGEVECTARPGDLLIMRPLLLHASSKAVQPRGRRRVLHFLFGPRDPGFALRWSLAI